MNLGSVWGAKDTDLTLEEEAEESIQATFEAGMRAGKLALMRQIDAVMLKEPFVRMDVVSACAIASMTNDEYSALALHEPDFFSLDRLPDIFRALTRYADWHNAGGGKN